MGLMAMRRMCAGAGAFSALAMAAAPASAGMVESVQVGVLQHNAEVLTRKVAGREDGVNIEAQFNLDPLESLALIGAPSPFAIASVNTEGDTSFAGVGLKWSWRLAEAWALEPELGYVIHDGELANPFPNGDPRATQFSDENLLFGSRDLFRVAFGLSRDVGEARYATLFYNHLSHGQILGNGRNQGVDQLGVRVGFRFEDGR